MNRIANRLKPIMKVVLRAAAGGGTVALLLAAVLAVGPRPAAATQAFTKETGLPCGQCHVGPTGGKLTPFGEKFKANGFQVK